MTTHITTIKDKIKTYLDDLVTASVLGGCTETDFRKNPVDDNTAGFPHAFLMPPATESEAIDNRTNLRTYTFGILVLMKGEDTSASMVEDLIQAILDKFDNLPTLGGVADGAVLPATSAPEPVRYGDKELISFVVSLQVRRTETLTF